MTMTYMGRPAFDNEDGTLTMLDNGTTVYLPVTKETDLNINMIDIMNEVNSTNTASTAAVERAAELRWSKEGSKPEVDMGTIISIR